jgi:hypothetical protein
MRDGHWRLEVRDGGCSVCAYHGSRTHVKDGATYCARLLSCIVLPFAGCCVVCLQLAAAATLQRCAPLTGAWTAPSCRATAQRARSCTGTHAQVRWPAHCEVCVLSATQSVSCHMACLFNSRTPVRQERSAVVCLAAPSSTATAAHHVLCLCACVSGTQQYTVSGAVCLLFACCTRRVAASSCLQASRCPIAAVTLSGVGGPACTASQ